MARAKWQPKQQPAARPMGRKGGFASDKNMDFNKSQSIEELTGGRLKKKSK